MASNFYSVFISFYFIVLALLLKVGRGGELRRLDGVNLNDYYYVTEEDFLCLNEAGRNKAFA